MCPGSPADPPNRSSKINKHAERCSTCDQKRRCSFDPFQRPSGDEIARWRTCAGCLGWNGTGRNDPIWLEDFGLKSPASYLNMGDNGCFDAQLSFPLNKRRFPGSEMKVHQVLLLNNNNNNNSSSNNNNNSNEERHNKESDMALAAKMRQ